MAFAHSVHRHRPALWFGALFLLVVFAEHTITTLPAFRQRPALSWGVAFDLLVVLPGLFYVLVVRRYALSLGTLMAAVGGGLALAHWLIPLAQQQPLQALRWLPVLLEGAALLALVAKARRLVQHYRAAGAGQPERWPRACAAVQHVLGWPGTLLVAEAEMLRYAATGWWGTEAARPGAGAYSNFRASGFTAFVVMAGVVVAIETAVVHLLASHWNPVLAQWLLLFDAYALVFVVAHGHAVRLTPTLLTPEAVHIRVGFLWQLTAARAALVAIELLREAPAARPGLLNLSKQLFTPPNLLLTFADPVAVTGPYGIRRTARQVAIYLDCPRDFIAQVGITTVSHPR